MNSQSEKSIGLVDLQSAGKDAAHEVGPLTVADYLYRIAAVTVGIILLATVV